MCKPSAIENEVVTRLTAVRASAYAQVEGDAFHETAHPLSVIASSNQLSHLLFAVTLDEIQNTELLATTHAQPFIRAQGILRIALSYRLRSGNQETDRRSAMDAICDLTHALMSEPFYVDGSRVEINVTRVIRQAVTRGGRFALMTQEYRTIFPMGV